MSKLKLCPFCGSEPEQYDNEYACCTGSKCPMPNMVIDNRVWNTRAVLAQEAGLVVEPVAWQLDVEGYTTVTYDNYQKVLAEQEHFRGRGRTAVIRNLFTSPPAPGEHK